MIKRVIKGNVFTTHLSDIAFAINTDGYNDHGFASQILMRYTGKFAITGEQPLGTLISAHGRGKNFHGLVCHTLVPGGWKKAPQAITEALNKIPVPDDKEIAVVLMGTGIVGTESGANAEANVKAIHASKKQCVVYSLNHDESVILDALGLKSFS